jgi:1-acyl-sn-glycerol-3-phosphate acyltransferase
MTPLRAYSTSATLVVTAALRLWAYRLAACLRGRSPRRALRIMQGWNRFAWKRLRLRVEVHGTPPPQPCLYVSNHRSYLDIAILNGALGTSFVSRADVASWPIFGAVAREIGTVFVDRDDPRGRLRAARQLMRRVRTASVTVFPEATTGGHRLPELFQPGLIRLLRHLHVPVVPVTLRYSDRRAYWVEDVTVWEHFSMHVVAGAALRCTVHIGPLIDPDAYADAERLGRAVYATVCAPIEALGECCNGESRVSPEQAPRLGRSR